MAVKVFTNALVTVNGVDLSDHVRAVTLNISADDVDTTAMSALGYRSRVAGLKEWSLDLEFNQDFAAGSVDATLWPILGTVVAVTVKPENAATSTTNPLYSGDVLVTGHTVLDGSVGDLATIGVSFPGAGALARSTV